LSVYGSLIIIGSGYVSGLTVVSGFLVGSLREDWLARGLAVQLRMWPLIALANLILAVLGFGYLLTMAVFAGGPNDNEFLRKLALFVGGLLLGGWLSFYSYHRILRRLAANAEGASSGSGGAS
jgi:hypothetical protein